MKILLPISISQPKQGYRKGDVIHYSTASECIEYIQQNESAGKFIVVINGESDEQTILPILQGLEQKPVFFILNSQNEAQLARTRRFDDSNSLSDHIQTALDDHQSQTLSLHFLSEDQRSMLDLSTETPYFMWNQIVLLALQQLPPEARSFEAMVNACIDFYQGDEIELKNVEVFRRSYRSDQAVKWYTCPGFVYRLVNRALRTRSIDALLSFAPFIWC